MLGWIAPLSPIVLVGPWDVGMILGWRMGTLPSPFLALWGVAMPLCQGLAPAGQSLPPCVHPHLALLEPTWTMASGLLCRVSAPSRALPHTLPECIPPHCIPALTSPPYVFALAECCPHREGAPQGQNPSSRPGEPHREEGEATKGSHAPSAGWSPSPHRAQAQAQGSEVPLRPGLAALLPSENRLCSSFMYL